MKPTQQQIVNAVARMSCLALFPNNPAAHKEIMRLLARMVATVQALDWLVVTMIDRVGEWKGTAQLRALMCTRFKPLDGEEGPFCQIDGFTPVDNENRFLEEHPRKQLKDPNHRSEFKSISQIKPS